METKYFGRVENMTDKKSKKSIKLYYCSKSKEDCVNDSHYNSGYPRGGNLLGYDFFEENEYKGEQLNHAKFRKASKENYISSAILFQ